MYCLWLCSCSNGRFGLIETVWPSVQRTANTAMTALLCKSCLQCWPLTTVWELGFQEGSHHPPTDEWLTVPKLIVSNVVYAKYLLSFWKSAILVCTRQRLPTRGAPRANSKCLASNTLPWDGTSSVCLSPLLGDPVHP